MPKSSDSMNIRVKHITPLNPQRVVSEAEALGLMDVERDELSCIMGEEQKSVVLLTSLLGLVWEMEMNIDGPSTASHVADV